MWGELKRWEGELGHTLVSWSKGQPALLSPFGEKLLWAERRAQARLAPQVEALRSELERAFAIAFDDSAGVIPMAASHDDALPLLRQRAHDEARPAPGHPVLRQRGRAGCAERRALPAGRLSCADRCTAAFTHRTGLPCAAQARAAQVGGFRAAHAGPDAAPGNPLGLQSLADLQRPGLRFAPRAPGTGTRVVLEELLAAARIDPAAIKALPHAEPSHRSAAEAVASGQADVSFGIEAAARARGLHFVPLAQEQYFLVVLQPTLEHPHVRALLELLRSRDWKDELNALPGYAAERSGEVLSLRRVLPWWNYRKPKS